MFILVSMTAASAVDNSQTDNIAAEESDTVTHDLLTDGNDTTCDFNSLNDEIKNTTDNTLKLEKNYTYNSDTDTNYTEGIVLDKDNFVIDSQHIPLMRIHRQEYST